MAAFLKHPKKSDIHISMDCDKGIITKRLYEIDK
jgi:hypothetical protein